MAIATNVSLVFIYDKTNYVQIIIYTSRNHLILL